MEERGAREEPSERRALTRGHVHQPKPPPRPTRRHPRRASRYTTLPGRPAPRRAQPSRARSNPPRGGQKRGQRAGRKRGARNRPACQKPCASHTTTRAEATRGPTPQGQLPSANASRAGRRPRCPPVPLRAGSTPFPRTPRSQDHTARRPSKSESREPARRSRGEHTMDAPRSVQPRAAARQLGQAECSQQTTSPSSDTQHPH